MQKESVKRLDYFVHMSSLPSSVELACCLRRMAQWRQHMAADLLLCCMLDAATAIGACRPWEHESGHEARLFWTRVHTQLPRGSRS